jgi:hypothetical protein
LAHLSFSVTVAARREFTAYKRRKQTMKYTIATVFVVVATLAGYFGIRRLAHKDLGFTRVKRYASKLANTLIHTEATAAQEAGVSPAA